MKRTVLVVDDEQNMQVVMRMILEGAGHHVLTAESGETALEHAQNPNLDVVLSDLKMPGMGGEQFAVGEQKADLDNGGLPHQAVRAGAARDRGTQRNQAAGYLAGERAAQGSS